MLESKSSLVKRMAQIYNHLADLMKIFEFLLSAYPNEFFDQNTINCSRFINFLKNVSTRLIAPQYLKNLLEIFSKSSSGKYKYLIH